MPKKTSEVYGDPEEHPQKETYWGHVNPIGIRSCYDEGKRSAESLIFDYHRAYKTDIKVIRIFNTYGPGMDPLDGRVVSNFIIQALNNQPITMYGDGKQTRSFCYVDDLINGIIKMMQTDYGITGPVNLGNPKEFTLLELAQKVLNLTGSKSKIVFEQLPQDDPKRRRPDIRKSVLFRVKNTFFIRTGISRRKQASRLHCCRFQACAVFPSRGKPEMVSHFRFQVVPRRRECDERRSGAQKPCFEVFADATTA